MPFDLGAVVPLGTEVRDAAGALANAGTMALTIGLPDGTSTTVSPVAPISTGLYAYDYPSLQAGRHTVRWVASGINAGAYSDVFDIRPAESPAIMSLADGKKHLNKDTTVDDDEVRFWIGVTTRAVEYFVGPVTVRTVTETHEVGQVDTLALRQVPALELQALEPLLISGTTYDVPDLDLDGTTGIVRRKDGAPLRGPLRATYSAGRRVVEENITGAARIILQHLWRTQQGPGRPQRGMQDFDVTEPIPGLGYAVPNRAVQLMNPDQLPPGIA